MERILTDTLVYRDIDGGRIPSGRYIWRGPADVPVFSLQDSRDVVSDYVDVICEAPCEAVVVIERTKRGPGVHPTTMHGFTRWRIYGNGLAERGFYMPGTIDENCEHLELHACSIYGCRFGVVAKGQQCKENLISHCRFESGEVAIIADSSFRLLGGTIAVHETGVLLSRVGDPVVIEGTGFEAVRRMLVAQPATTASQPITLTGCRYEADQLAENGDCIVLGSAGPLVLSGCRFGGGRQRIPRIALMGLGEQTALISGCTFGSYGAYRACPVRVANSVTPRVTFSRNVYQRAEGDPTNTHHRVTAWSRTQMV